MTTERSMYSVGRISTVSTATTASTNRRHAPLLGATRIFNKLVLPLAGTRVLPLYGVLEHRGRRSGKVFRTPVVVRRAADGDGFIVPMPWGLGTDWYRNVRAAGGCRVRWKVRDSHLVTPEVTDPAAAPWAFGAG